MQPYKFREDAPWLWWRRNYYLLRSQLRGRFSPSDLQERSGLEYLGSGWEWSAYLNSDTNRIEKYSAGKFDFVNAPEYLASIEENYRILRRLDPDLCVPTIFKREHGENKITQRQVKPFDEWFYFRSLPTNKRTALSQLIVTLQTCLDTHVWLPDVRPKYWVVAGYLSNLTWNEDFEKFQILDFSAALDLFRVDPEFTKSQVRHFNYTLTQIKKKL